MQGVRCRVHRQVAVNNDQNVIFPIYLIYIFVCFPIADDIIDKLVEDFLSPDKVCTAITACP